MIDFKTVRRKKPATGMRPADTHRRRADRYKIETYLVSTTAKRRDRSIFETYFTENRPIRPEGDKIGAVSSLNSSKPAAGEPLRSENELIAARVDPAPPCS